MLALDLIRLQKKQDFNLIGKVKIRLVIFLSTLLAFLIFSQLIFASNLATNGEKISQIENEILFMQSQNSRLRIEIAKESSFASLSEKAKDLSFVSPQKVIIP